MLASLFAAAALSLTAESPFQLVHDKWGTSEGLPQSSVTAILQAHDGYLWLGTQGGLVRFDGVRFQLLAPATHPGMTSSRVRSLFEDRHRTLWIGTEDGGLLTYKGGVFAPVTAPEFSVTTVTIVADAGNDGVWVGTSAGLFEMRGGSVRPRLGRDGASLTPLTNPVGDEAGDLWIGTRAGLVRFRPDGVDTYTSRDGLPHDEVRALLRSRDGSLWIGTARGIARWRNGTISRPPLGALNTVPVNALYEEATGLWIGTPNDLYRLVDDRATPVPSMRWESILSITSDREGNLWIGTVMNGLMRLKAARVAMLHVKEGGGVGVVPIVEDREGTMWIGGSCTGLLRDRSGERRLIGSKDGLPAACIWSLLADRDGVLWIGTLGNGVIRHANGVFRSFTRGNSGLLHDDVLALFQDSHGVIWIGTRGGLQAFANGTFTAYRVADGLVNDDVRFVTEARDGAIWIATTGGISRFAGGRFTNYTTANGLAHNAVRAIHEDVDGTLWFGSYGGGLMRFKDGRFTHITQQNGLFDDVVSRILEDDRGNLWMSGNRGIFRASRESLNAFADGRARAVASISYGVSDGMLTHETNGGGQPAGWKSRDGRLWFPTINGVAIIDPRTPDAVMPPPIVIERVAVDDRELDRAGPIVLPSGRMRLEIAYTALSLTAPERSQFRYRLEGYETEAVEAGTRRVAYYTNLPPGNYVFRATGSNHDGKWNTEGATLDVTITAPFWMTWWFRGSAALVLAAMGFTLHRARIAQLDRRQQQHEAFTRQLIDSQEAERARIARELHDTLGQSLVLIKNQAQLGLRQPEGKGGAAMTEISSMAAQAITEVKEIAYDLRPYQLDRLGLTRALEALAARVASSTGLPVNARLEKIDGVLPKDAEITLYRIVQESLNNIVKHAQATAIDVTIDRDDAAVRARIRDNGRGFDVTEVQRAQGGMGLAGMSERAAMLRATLNLVSSAGRGTTIAVTIPLPGAPPSGDPSTGDKR
jgi:signal transduction histidine kinase/ligand-binding sensor domain-containing protein